MGFTYNKKVLSKFSLKFKQKNLEDEYTQNYFFNNLKAMKLLSFLSLTFSFFLLIFCAYILIESNNHFASLNLKIIDKSIVWKSFSPIEIQQQNLSFYDFLQTSLKLELYYDKYILLDQQSEDFFLSLVENLNPMFFLENQEYNFTNIESIFSIDTDFNSNTKENTLLQKLLNKNFFNQFIDSNLTNKRNLNFITRQNQRFFLNQTSEKNNFQKNYSKSFMNINYLGYMIYIKNYNINKSKEKDLFLYKIPENDADNFKLIKNKKDEVIKKNKINNEKMLNISKRILNGNHIINSQSQYRNLGLNGMDIENNNTYYAENNNFNIHINKMQSNANTDAIYDESEQQLLDNEIFEKIKIRFRNFTEINKLINADYTKNKQLLREFFFGKSSLYTTITSFLANCVILFFIFTPKFKQVYALIFLFFYIFLSLNFHILSGILRSYYYLNTEYLFVILGLKFIIKIFIVLKIKIFWLYFFATIIVKILFEFLYLLLIHLQINYVLLNYLLANYAFDIASIIVVYNNEIFLKTIFYYIREIKIEKKYLNNLIYNMGQGIISIDFENKKILNKNRIIKIIFKELEDILPLLRTSPNKENHSKIKNKIPSLNNCKKNISNDELRNYNTDKVMALKIHENKKLNNAVPSLIDKANLKVKATNNNIIYKDNNYNKECDNHSLNNKSQNKAKIHEKINGIQIPKKK